MNANGTHQCTINPIFSFFRFTKLFSASNPFRVVTNRDASLFLHIVEQTTVDEILYRPTATPAPLTQLCAWKLTELYDVKDVLGEGEQRGRVKGLLKTVKSLQPYMLATLAALEDPHLVKMPLTKWEMRAILQAIVSGRAVRVDDSAARKVAVKAPAGPTCVENAGERRVMTESEDEGELLRELMALEQGTSLG